MITSNRKMSLMLPQSMEDAIIALHKTEKYRWMSYEEIIRRLIEAGLKTFVQ